MGNEGKLVAVLPQEQAEQALEVIRSSKYGTSAAIIGKISHLEDETVLLHTPIGGTRVLGELYGEGLPRIC